MHHSCLADRLTRYLRLTAEERQALAELEGSERAVPRGTVLNREQTPSREFYIVRRGWLYSSVLLADGNRQILSLHLPGELAGDTVLPWAQAPFALTAVTDAAVHAIDKAGFRRLFEHQPRLATLIHALSQVERAVLCDRLASVGRTSALARIAALIIDAMQRLRAGGEPDLHDFALPLTQEEIGDLAGLTAVHVNRMMRRLVEEGLIARASNRIHVLDEERLARLANHVDRYGAIDASWLPPARE